MPRSWSGWTATPARCRPADRVALGTGHRQSWIDVALGRRARHPARRWPGCLSSTTPPGRGYRCSWRRSSRAPAARRSRTSRSWPPGPGRHRDRRAGRRWLSARHAGQPRVHVGRAQALPRPDLLPLSGGDRGAAYGRYVHGDSDTTGVVRAVEAIARGLGWRRAQARWACSATRTGRTSRPAGSLAPRWRPA
jgi:hypothetical protein